MPRFSRNVLLSVIIVLVLLAVISRYMPAVGQPVEINYSTFLDDVKANRVDSVTFQDDMLYGRQPNFLARLLLLLAPLLLILFFVRRLTHRMK